VRVALQDGRPWPDVVEWGPRFSPVFGIFPISPEHPQCVVLFTVALAFVVCWLPWRRPSTRWTRLPLLTPAVCIGSRPASSASLHRCYCEYLANSASSPSCWFICLRPVASHSFSTLHPPTTPSPIFFQRDVSLLVRSRLLPHTPFCTLPAGSHPRFSVVIQSARPLARSVWIEPAHHRLDPVLPGVCPTTSAFLLRSARVGDANRHGCFALRQAVWSLAQRYTGTPICGAA
jgi:hypothetical protein